MENPNKMCAAIWVVIFLMFINIGNINNAISEDVIVYFKNSVNESDIKSWADKNKVKILKRLSLYKKNAYLISSPDGVRSAGFTKKLNIVDAVFSNKKIKNITLK